MSECNRTLVLARACLSSGLSIVPVRLDASKAPTVPWTPYQTELPLIDEIDSWWDQEPVPGIAVIGGKVSGGLTVIDIEYMDYFEEFHKLVESQAPGLLARLPIVATPGKTDSGGRHLYFRMTNPPRSAKLAKFSADEAIKRTGDAGKTTAVEVKGAGGYVLTVGCPPACHPAHREYQHIGGPPITQTPKLTDDEAEILLSSARALSRVSDEEPRFTGPSGADRPGDEFNQKAEWTDILRPHHWEIYEQRGDGATYWTRPGKKTGVSASTGFCKNESGDLLYVFTTNAAPFQNEKCYSRFSAYALLNHGGDYKAATKALVEKGYGTPPGKIRFGSRPRPTPSCPAIWA